MESLLKVRKFEVFRKEIIGNDGKARPFEFVSHTGSVTILPLIDDKHCLMLRQFRPALDRELWELPAGTMDKPGEKPEETARRELEEETGHVAARFEFLCEFYLSPGFLNEKIQSFVARDLKKKSTLHLEPTEKVLAVEVKSLKDAMEMIRKGEIVDAKTIITLMRYVQ